MNRENVIKGITHHKLGMCDMSGKICPYWNEDDGCSKKMLEDVLSLLKEQEETIRNLEQEIRDKNERLKERAEQVDAMLKEQEAVKPYSMNAERTYGICPKCEKIVFRYGNVKGNHYCGICGQAVKWE